MSTSPSGRPADFLLGGKPFMLMRGTFRGRSWQRTSAPDSPARRTGESAPYGNLPSEIDHVEAWDDWSGGFGDAYRDPARPNRVHWSENMDTRFPRQMVHCQTVPVSPRGTLTVGNADVEHIIDVPPLNSLFWPPGAGTVILSGRSWTVGYTPTTAGSALVELMEGSAKQIGKPALFGSYVYGATWEASSAFFGFVQLKTHDTTVPPIYADAYATGMYAREFVVAGRRLWRAHGPHPRASYLQSADIGGSIMIQANWSATLNVGLGKDINSLLAYGDQVYAGLPDGLYAGDTSGTFYNVLGQLADSAHVDNARDLTIHNNAIMVPHVGGIIEYVPSDYEARAREIGPPTRGNRGPVRGRVRALHSYGEWLYAGLFTGSQSYILAGRDGGPDGYDWHVQQRLPATAKVHRLHIDGITSQLVNPVEIPNRMWIATEASFGAQANCTAPLYQFPIPLANGNPLGAALPFSANYVGSARVDLPAVDWAAPGTPKVLRTVEVWSELLASGAQYADVYYTVDGGTRTLLGQANVSPKHTLYFPSGDGLFTTGQSVVLSLESFTKSSGVTPVYRSIVLRGALRPSKVDQITAYVRIADGIRDRQQKAMRPGAMMLAELRAFADGATPRQLVDLAGATHWVAVMQGIGEQEVYQQGDEAPEIAATVRMAVLSFTSGG